MNTKLHPYLTKAFHVLLGKEVFSMWDNYVVACILFFNMDKPTFWNYLGEEKYLVIS